MVAETSELKRTPLYETHIALGAQMVNFGGWDMPVRYPARDIAEHLAVRNTAGVFDVSHMGRWNVKGSEAADLLNLLTVNDVDRLRVGQAQYSMFCLPNGGVLDDILVYRRGEQDLMVVVNAGNREADLEWVTNHQPIFNAKVNDISDQTGLVALQGPIAEQVLKRLSVETFMDLKPFRFRDGRLLGHEVTVSRTGYTGEDGFEIMADARDIVEIFLAALDAGKTDGVLPCGLGARDSLRLEAGLPLHGHEISRDINPFEANLDWVVKMDKAGGFIGREALLKAKERGLRRQLVGLIASDRRAPRPEVNLKLEVDGQVIAGNVVSGLSSPTLGRGIATAFMPIELAGQEGLPVSVVKKGSSIETVITRLPFYRRKGR